MIVDHVVESQSSFCVTPTIHITEIKIKIVFVLSFVSFVLSVYDIQ